MLVLRASLPVLALAFLLASGCGSLPGTGSGSGSGSGTSSGKNCNINPCQSKSDCYYSTEQCSNGCCCYANDAYCSSNADCCSGFCSANNFQCIPR